MSIAGQPEGMVVLGMHRGGTSATAGALVKLGLSAGSKATLKGASPVNPSGFWEQPPLTRFNEQLLTRLESSWDSPPDVTTDPGWLGRLQETRAQARSLFGGVFQEKNWVWKDPRNCVLLPYWLDALSTRPVVVLVLRNPVDIAASLQARENATPFFAISLWERYMRHALHACRGLAVMVTRYSDLLADPGAWGQTTSITLSEHGVQLRSQEQDEVEAFIDPTLQHHESSRERLVNEPWASSEQVRLFDLLEGLVGDHSDFTPPELQPETPHVEWILAERRRAIREQRQLRERFQKVSPRERFTAFKGLLARNSQAPGSEAHDGVDPTWRSLVRNWARRRLVRS